VLEIDVLVMERVGWAMHRVPRVDGRKWGEFEGSVAALGEKRASLGPQIKVCDPDKLDLVGSIVSHFDDTVSGSFTVAKWNVGGTSTAVEIRFPDESHHDGRRNGCCGFVVSATSRLAVMAEDGEEMLHLVLGSHGGALPQRKGRLT
jgi:hypothetical protein